MGTDSNGVKAWGGDRSGRRGVNGGERRDISNTFNNKEKLKKNIWG